MEEKPIFVKMIPKSLKTDESNQKSYLKILQNIREGIQRKPYPSKLQLVNIKHIHTFKISILQKFSQNPSHNFKRKP